jgi:Mg-chelatase subunit ChlD
MHSKEEILARWRLMLGGGEADGTGLTPEGQAAAADAALDALYEYDHRQKFVYGPGDGNRKGGSGTSQPALSRWLGDIRRYFSEPVAKVIQQDALRHPILQKKLLLEPEILEQATPDVHLAATLIELGKVIPAKTKATARQVVRKVVENLMERLQHKTIQALSGALLRSARQQRPKWKEVDWSSTIRRNLQYYSAEYQTVVPQYLVGYGHKKRQTLKDIVICLDQSGSMATSIIYAAVFGAVLASLPGLRTRFVVFDTSVVDLTDDLHDPVDILFGVQLGGGTDIAGALAYCRQQIERPADTILVLISDLYEGSAEAAFQHQLTELAFSGVQVIGLLALSDDGAPAYDHKNATFMAQLGMPVFACTPDLFPDVMATALAGQNLRQWASEWEVGLK